MNSSRQCSGIVGATAGRTMVRSPCHRCRMDRIRSIVSCQGGSPSGATALRSCGGSASIRPGIASYNVMSAIIGAMTARMPACT